MLKFSNGLSSCALFTKSPAVLFSPHFQTMPRCAMNETWINFQRGWFILPSMRVDIPSTRGISWWSSPHQRWYLCTLRPQPLKSWWCTLCYSTDQWEFQDPKMEVPYHIRPYFVVIFHYIGLIKALHMVGTSNLGSWNGHWLDPPLPHDPISFHVDPCYQVFPIVVHATTASSATPSAFGCDAWLPRKAAADASGARWRRRWPGAKEAATSLVITWDLNNGYLALFMVDWCGTLWRRQTWLFDNTGR